MNLRKRLTMMTIAAMLAFSAVRNCVKSMANFSKDYVFALSSGNKGISRQTMQQPALLLKVALILVSVSLDLGQIASGFLLLQIE